MKKIGIFIVIGVVVAGLIIYYLTQKNDPRSSGTAPAGHSDPANSQPTKDIAASNQKSTKSDSSVNELNFKDPHLAGIPEVSQAKADFEDLNPPCPTRTQRVESILKCPKVPASLLTLLKKLNYKKIVDDCEVESRTTNINLGDHFIAWTLVQKNSCENRAYPHGLPEEMTYYFKDELDVDFAEEFRLPELEKYFLTGANLNSGVDRSGKKCPAPKIGRSPKPLGTLGSEFTKAQFRLVDNTKSIRLKMLAFYQVGSQGRVCNAHVMIDNWRAYLGADSRFHNKKAEELFKE